MFSKWLWKKQVLLHADRYFVKALLGQQAVTACATMLAAGCLFLPSQWTQQYKQTIRAKHQPGLHSFFSPNPQPKALDQKPPQPCPSSSPSPCWPQPAHGTGLVCFFSQFSFTMSVYPFLSPVNLSCCLWPTRGVFPRASPIFPVPPLPPCIRICFRETSCCLEAALNSRGPRAKWRFGYSSSMSKWKEAA